MDELRQHDNGIVLLRLWGMGETVGAIDGQRQQAVIEWTWLPVYQDRDPTTMSTWPLAQKLGGTIRTKGGDHGGQL